MINFLRLIFELSGTLNVLVPFAILSMITFGIMTGRSMEFTRTAKGDISLKLGCKNHSKGLPPSE